MIIADLETTQQTERSDLGTFEYTDLFYNLTYAGTKYKNYCLGYISKDNLPITMRANKCTFADGVATFEDNTADANFPCGYFYENPNYSGGYGSAQQNGANPPNFGENPFRFARLINQLYPEAVGEARGVSFGIVAIMYTPGASPTYAGTVVNETLGLNALQSWNFLKYPNTVFTKTFSNSAYGSFDFCANDFENNESSYFETTTGYFARVFIINVNFGNMYRYYNGSTYDIALPFFANVEFKTPITYDNRNISNILITNTANPSTQQSDAGFAKYSGGTMDCGPNYARGLMPTGATGRIDVDGLIANHSTPWVYDNDILAFYKYDWGHKVFFKCIRRPSDIMKQLSLFMRVLPNGGYNTTYNLGIYATDVTENDEFLARLKTGDIADPAFKNSLRPWQYEDFQSNDFDPDNDIPPYTPEPGGGDDPGSDEPVDTPLVTGDDQELQPDRTLSTPNDFITMYNITPPMLTIFGKTLWKSIVDYDPNDPTSIEVFKNFFTFINESVTGSIDIGSLLQFVVGVRQYPFNVAGMGITESAGNAIKIGTGNFPLELGSGANVQRLTSTIGLLDCGTVTIADYSDFKLYNDFRDYLNTSVSAFLPYCGTVELNPIEVIHNTLHCYYAIDFYTGECTAYITCTDGNHKWISAIKNGTIGVLIPLTATNSGQISARHQSDNARDSGLIASTMGNLFGAVANVATGNIVGAVGNVVGIAQNDAQQRQMDAERQGRSAIMAPSLSGGSGAAAFYQPSCASVLVRRGTYARDKIANYPSTCAYPATTSGTLSSFHGYTECYNVDVNQLSCNEEERAQVKMILETGVYLP